MKISALINTLNEEKNIEKCLQSLSWVDEIILVDMYSDDKTVEIAKKYTDKIFYFERVGYADPARAFALSQVSNEWVVVLDADEVIPKSLSDELIAIAKEDKADAIWIPRKNFMFGHEIKHTGWNMHDDIQMRFFKKIMMTYGSTIHNFVNISDQARIITLKNNETCIWHFNYIDIEHFLEKLNKYTTVEAKQLFDKRKQSSFLIVIYTCIREFVYRFILKSGYKDGFYGLVLSLLMCVYRFTTLAKLKIMIEQNNVTPRDSIVATYDDLSSKVIDSYK